MKDAACLTDRKPTNNEEYGTTQILSVDDEPVNHMVIEECINSTDYKVACRSPAHCPCPASGCPQCPCPASVCPQCPYAASCCPQCPNVQNPDCHAKAIVYLGSGTCNMQLLGLILMQLDLKCFV